jgi:hypothetical protein
MCGYDPEGIGIIFEKNTQNVNGEKHKPSSALTHFHITTGNGIAF